MTLDPVVLSYLAAAIVAATGFYTANSIRKKNEASAAESLTNSAIAIAKSKDRDAQDCRTENINLKLYIEYLRVGIKLLQLQITKDNHEPNFDPKSLDRFNADNN